MNDLARYFSDPLVLGGAAVLVILVLLGVGWVLYLGRRSKGMNEDQIRAHLASLERDTPLLDAVEQVEFQASPEETAAHISAVCKEYLSLPVFKIYAGKEGNESYPNVLPKPENAIVTNDLAQTGALPATLPGPLIAGFTKPQSVNINALLGTAAVGTGQGVTVIPWHGAFGWGGLMIAGAMNSNPADALAGEQEALRSLSHRLAVALEMAQVGVEGHSSQQTTSVEHFYQTLLKAMDWQASRQDVIRAAADVIGADSSSLWLYDTNTQMLGVEASSGLKTTEFLPLPPGQGLAGNVFETATPLALSDAPGDPRCIFPREALESGIGSYLGVPISIDDSLVGVLEVHTKAPKYWSDDEVEKLESIALALASALKHQTPGSHNLKVESAYLGLSEALQRLRTKDELLEAVVEVFGNALSVSRAVVVEFDNSSGTATIRHEFRMPGTNSAVGTVIDAGARTSVSATHPLAAAEAGLRSFLGEEAAERLGVVSELAVPIRETDETGVIVLLQQCDRVRSWNPDEVEFVSRVGRQLALSLDHISSETTSERPDGSQAVARAEDAAVRPEMINSLPEAVIALDEGGRLTFFNRMAGSWLGLQASDIGKPAASLKGLAMTDETLWNRVLASRSVQRFEVRRKITAPAESGLSLLESEEESRTVSISVAPVQNDGGKGAGFVLILSDINHIPQMAADVMARITKLKEQQAEIERNIAEARAAELQARARIERLNTLESGAREGGGARRLEEELMAERERFRNEKVELQRSVQQLLDTNKLKSEFIVNCGRDIEASIQAATEVAKRLNEESYGGLSDQQQEVVRELLTIGDRLKSDVDNLIEYGAARLR